MKDKKMIKEKLFWNELWKLLIYFFGAMMVIIVPIYDLALSKQESNNIVILLLTIFTLILFVVCSFVYLYWVINDYTKKEKFLIIAYTIASCIFLIILYALNIKMQILEKNEGLMIIPIFLVFANGIIGSDRLTKAYKLWRNEEKIKKGKNEN